MKATDKIKSKTKVDRGINVYHLHIVVAVKQRFASN